MELHFFVAGFVTFVYLNAFLMLIVLDFIYKTNFNILSVIMYDYICPIMSVDCLYEFCTLNVDMQIGLY